MPELVRLLRAMPGSTEAIRAALVEADLERLRLAASAHALSPVVFQALVKAAVPLSPPLERQFRADAAKLAAPSIRIRLLLLQALDALAAEGVVPVLLKGPGLAARLYPDAAMRLSVDLDFLVARSELTAADRALRALGLDCPGGSLEAHEKALHHSVNFFGPQGSVEVHFRFHAPGAWLEGVPLLAQACEGTFEGRRVRFLAPEDELLHLAAHAAGHLFARLGWLYDIKLYVDRGPKVDWERLVERARFFGAEGPVFFGFEAASRLTGAVIPESALHQLRPSRWQALAARHLFPEERVERAPLPSRPVGLLLRTLLASSPRRMARFAGQRMWRNIARSRRGA